jgi:hypothetical protein
VECGLPLIAFMDADIVVPPADVELGEVSRVLEPMDEVVDEGERIAILPGDHVQSSVVLDKAELSIFLLDEEDRGSER